MASEPTILPQHQELLTASAIAPEVASARGYRSVTTKSELGRLGFSPKQQNVPGLLIPIHDSHGKIATYQFRPDQPRIGDKGKPIKYETPKGSRMVLDVPPGARAWLGDPRYPLFITEGCRKADAAVSFKLCCIAVLGVWNWRGSNADGGKAVLPDWESIALNGRLVYLVFDSDAFSKKEVRNALSRLREYLGSKDAHVKVVRLPPGEGGVKVGLDDYLVSGRNVTDLLACVTDEPLLPEVPPNDGVGYEASEHGIFHHRQAEGSTVPVQLTNFTARIVTEIRADDGVEEELSFEIEATLHDRQKRFLVPANKFASMNWPIEQLGAGAVIFPGFARDHARTAIQLLSGDIPQRRVFSYLGWREFEDEWVYLHATGGIGPGGPRSEIEVALPDALRHYDLPEPPTGGELRNAVRTSLRILDLAPDVITVPLLGACFRAPLGHADFSIHLNGDTGEGKTALAILAQQHFGARHDFDCLPASWASTANALEAIAFTAKDALLVVDDFVPKGPQADVQRLHRDAERLLRAQANASGRQRMRADTTLRPAKPPRGLILSTGEEIPRGKSLRARLLILELERGDVNWGRLTVAQEAGRKALYAQTQSAYLVWLAGRYGRIRKDIGTELRAFRDQAVRGTHHKRTPFIVASLALGFSYFLRFAADVGALDAGECKSTGSRVWRALGQAAAAQSKFLDSEEPTRRFLELLIAAVSSGRAHVASTSGGPPSPSIAWGWREVRYGNEGLTEWRPQGECIGWVDESDLYLEPGAAFSAAENQARRAGESLGISQTTLYRRLHERGLLMSTDPGRETLRVRKTLAGTRRDVLHLPATSILGKLPDQPDQSDLGSKEDDVFRSGSWSGSDRSGAKPDQETRPHPPGNPVASDRPGRVGRVADREESPRLDEGSDTPAQSRS